MSEDGEVDPVRHGRDKCTGRDRQNPGPHEAVELATLQWVHWFNHIRLLEPIGYIPPAEAEAHYWRQLDQKTVSAIST
jgi:transposase InsO family protein